MVGPNCPIVVALGEERSSEFLSDSACCCVVLGLCSHCSDSSAWLLALCTRSTAVVARCCCLVFSGVSGQASAVGPVALLMMPCLIQGLPSRIWCPLAPSPPPSMRLLRQLAGAFASLLARFSALCWSSQAIGRANVLARGVAARHSGG